MTRGLEVYPLKYKFPGLFLITYYLEGSVVEIGIRVDEIVIFGFRWRKTFFFHEESVVIEFLLVIWVIFFPWKEIGGFGILMYSHCPLSIIICWLLPLLLATPSLHVICLSTTYRVVRYLLRWSFSLGSFSSVISPLDRIYLREIWLWILVIFCVHFAVLSSSRLLTYLSLMI